MMILIQDCDLYAPESMGRRDVLMAAGKIIAVEPSIPVPTGVPVTVIKAGGKRLIPGLIDNHAHIAGAGGEGGPSTRTPEMNLGQFLVGGITTVVGCLGTDGMTRSVESVLMKAKALKEEGMSAWIYTGAYQVPTPTILGDVGRDIALIEEVIGAGEIAISDHRSSFPSVEELIRIAEHARVGGMLGGKAGIVNLHMGDAKDPFALLREVVRISELKLTQFIPTHCNRNDYIFEDAKEYGKTGYVDITTSSYHFFPEYEIKPCTALRLLLEAGVPLDHITFSSDGGGSLPHFDEKGNLVKLVSGEPKSLFVEIMEAVRDEGLPLETALAVATTTPAAIFGMKAKGSIAPGKDADAVLLGEDDSIQYVIAKGAIMVSEGARLVKGRFEP
ncbi:MAG TPA: beta-aspartyl-peptidase [Thermoanaerobaculia bacterium]|nr:beta-aspartyl-peptidase [Thermoanaerobaculia bacterium]HUM30936.1 beta-aspartyl-peptidase [Thermoanaerobaculia bacterium]HXK69269.1 beta-aspartyl-peptidase [Thermoanaerobaculia bacterium]